MEVRLEEILYGGKTRGNTVNEGKTRGNSVWR